MKAKLLVLSRDLSARRHYVALATKKKKEQKKTPKIHDAVSEQEMLERAFQKIPAISCDRKWSDEKWVSLFDGRRNFRFLLDFFIL